MGREFELKYTATEAILDKLAAAFGPGREIQMKTTYFDTTDAALSAARCTLRLRWENGSRICTFKTALPDGSRGEWECDASDIECGVAGLLRLGAPEMLNALEGLAPVCGARFTRRAIALPTADGMAELALDSGVLTGGGREIPLCEVELEHKSGSEEATLALAAQIAAAYGLQPEPKSKFQRASILRKV